MIPTLETELTRYVERKRDRLVGLVQKLVQMPSENTPPDGAEGRCQAFIAEHLSTCGMTPSVYKLGDVPGLAEHPLYWPGRNYENRPNVGAKRTGSGGGRSLVLSGHIDTVPAGSLPWTVRPFGGEIDGNRLYGRGSNDMKAGAAVNLFVAEALHELGIRLCGDVIFESIVDEEFGGSNGTIAGRLMGFNADAAVISEPTNLRICPAQRGGRIAHLTLRAIPNAGILSDGTYPQGVIPVLRAFLNAVPSFAERRRSTAPVHPLYAKHPDPVPVCVTKISTGPWGNSEPQLVPDTCQLEFFWQAMPGETRENIDAEFFAWLNGITAERQAPPDVEFPIRWLPGSAIPTDAPLVVELQRTAGDVLRKTVPVVGMEGPADMFVFQQGFNIPAVMWGPTGGNTHVADEYVELDSVVDAAKVLLHFVCEWCKTA